MMMRNLVTIFIFSFVFVPIYIVCASNINDPFYSQSILNCESQHSNVLRIIKKWTLNGIISAHDKLQQVIWLSSGHDVLSASFSSVPSPLSPWQIESISLDSVIWKTDNFAQCGSFSFTMKMIMEKE